MADTTNGSTEKQPVKKFRVKVGDTVVTVAIAAKGGLSVYAWEDANGYHSLGRFPLTRYSSQWKAEAAIIPAVMRFIEADEASDNPKLATKQTKGATYGETLEFDAVETLDELLGMGGQ